MKATAGACFALALGVLGWWYASGPTLATLTQIGVEKVEVDEFGDEVKTTVWEDGFVLGLDYAGPAAGALAGLGAVILFAARRRTRRPAA